MSCIETMNLIDFGNEDAKCSVQKQESIPSNKALFTEPSATLVSHMKPMNLSCPNRTSPQQRRESLDNNPFDVVQKLANRPDDPFEIVEKQACQKARLNQTTVNVKLGKLLSLSDDNLLDNDDDVDTHVNDKFTTCVIDNNDTPKCGSDSTALSLGTASIYNNANTCGILDSESPPISLSQKWGSDSGHSSDSAGGSASSTDASSSAKNKKAIEYRKRLLKLSITNSTFHTPVNHRTPPRPNMDGFTESNNISMILTEAAQLGEHLIAAESPLKLVDDDLMAEEPNWIDSEKDFDDDLEMLKIPMLKELPSPVVEETPKIMEQSPPSFTGSGGETKESAPLSDLAAIRAKLKAKRELSNNNKDITSLIDTLKSLISDINVSDQAKKQQATSLLDTLSSDLKTSATKKYEEAEIQKTDEDLVTVTPPPQPIVRQGTFNIELQDKKEQEEKATEEHEKCDGQEESSSQIPPTSERCEEIPDAMIRSSATYDGENADEREDLALPEIQPLTQPQLDVNEIVEQIGKLLEQQQLNNKEAGGGVGSVSQSGGGINPTFIVVMNTGQTPLNTATVQQQYNYMASCLESSFNEATPTTTNAHSTSMMRRRSQSLSIHDKVKVMQLPIVSSCNVATDSDGQLPGSPEATPPSSADGVEFKTPSRSMMVRRNSFSSGTPVTPITSNYGAMAAQRRASGMHETVSQLQFRRPTSSLSTHHEHERNSGATPVTVRPMQHLNLNAPKPDLINKKKLKSNNGAESIFKSSGPMKATIPVKKVAPMIKVSSPPIPDSAAFRSKPPPSSLNSSMQLVALAGKIPLTSTPMPMRGGGAAAVAHEIVPSGFPNACSTPSVRTSPMKSSAMNAARRYSYIPTTPSVKHSSASSSTAAAAASSARRRTLCELKAKSPNKARLSNSGGGTAASKTSNPSLKTASVARNSGKVNLNVPRTAPNKSAPTVSSARSSSNRIVVRTSFAGPMATKRNKENKQPQ